MKLKDAYFFTLREDSKDEDSVSSNLLVKAGFIKKTSAGIYMMLPPGLRVQKKIEAIIRKRMDETGAQEMRMPALIAQDYYEKSGRIKNFGPSVFKLKDRNNSPFVLGPTHEELFALAAKSMIHSYKDMPFNLYQIQTKYRDEPRARYGLIRVKEFVMKDAYSFDCDEAGLNISYQKMFDAYKLIFNDLNLNYRIVKADTGIMGGLLSEEFQAITPIGEDDIVYCDNCGFSSNIEISPVYTKENKEDIKEKELVITPGKGSIEEVAEYLNIATSKTIKALLLDVDNSLVICFIRGDRQLNETKLLKLLNAYEVKFAKDELIKDSGAVAHYTGPFNLKCKVVIDKEILEMHNFVCGANRENYHYINCNPADLDYDLSGDISNVKDGDLCPNCHAVLKFTKGIEIGNTFKLGIKYAEALNLTYTDANNELKPVYMGSYGIGIGRCMAAVVEQHHDEKGIIWPENIAPYKACIVLVSNKDEIACQLADELYALLKDNGIDTLYDNRDLRVGVKFNDMELIGIPYRFTIGKKANDGIIEYQSRDGSIKGETKLSDILDILTSHTSLSNN